MEDGGVKEKKRVFSPPVFGGGGSKWGKGRGENTKKTGEYKGGGGGHILMKRRRSFGEERREKKAEKK